MRHLRHRLDEAHGARAQVSGRALQRRVSTARRSAGRALEAGGALADAKAGGRVLLAHTVVVAHLAVLRRARGVAVVACVSVPAVTRAVVLALSVSAARLRLTRALVVAVLAEVRAVTHLAGLACVRGLTLALAVDGVARAVAAAHLASRSLRARDVAVCAAVARLALARTRVSRIRLAGAVDTALAAARAVLAEAARRALALGRSAARVGRALPAVARVRLAARAGQVAVVSNVAGLALRAPSARKVAGALTLAERLLKQQRGRATSRAPHSVRAALLLARVRSRRRNTEAHALARTALAELRVDGLTESVAALRALRRRALVTDTTLVAVRATVRRRALRAGRQGPLVRARTLAHRLRVVNLHDADTSAVRLGAALGATRVPNVARSALGAVTRLVVLLLALVTGKTSPAVVAVTDALPVHNRGHTVVTAVVRVGASAVLRIIHAVQTAGASGVQASLAARAAVLAGPVRDACAGAIRVTPSVLHHIRRMLERRAVNVNLALLRAASVQERLGTHVAVTTVLRRAVVAVVALPVVSALTDTLTVLHRGNTIVLARDGVRAGLVLIAGRVHLRLVSALAARRLVVDLRARRARRRQPAVLALAQALRVVEVRGHVHILRGAVDRGVAGNALVAAPDVALGALLAVRVRVVLRRAHIAGGTHPLVPALALAVGDRAMGGDSVAVAVNDNITLATTRVRAHVTVLPRVGSRAVAAVRSGPVVPARALAHVAHLLDGGRLTITVSVNVARHAVRSSAHSICCTRRALGVENRLAVLAVSRVPEVVTVTQALLAVARHLRRPVARTVRLRRAQVAVGEAVAAVGALAARRVVQSNVALVARRTLPLQFAAARALVPRGIRAGGHSVRGAVSNGARTATEGGILDVSVNALCAVVSREAVLARVTLVSLEVARAGARASILGGVARDIRSVTVAVKVDVALLALRVHGRLHPARGTVLAGRGHVTGRAGAALAVGPLILARADAGLRVAVRGNLSGVAVAVVDVRALNALVANADVSHIAVAAREADVTGAALAHALLRINSGSGAVSAAVDSVRALRAGGEDDVAGLALIAVVASDGDGAVAAVALLRVAVLALTLTRSSVRRNRQRVVATVLLTAGQALAAHEEVANNTLVTLGSGVARLARLAPVALGVLNAVAHAGTILDGDAVSTVAAVHTQVARSTLGERACAHTSVARHRLEARRARTTVCSCPRLLADTHTLVSDHRCGSRVSVARQQVGALVTLRVAVPARSALATLALNRSVVEHVVALVARGTSVLARALASAQRVVEVRADNTSVGTAVECVAARPALQLVTARHADVHRGTLLARVAVSERVRRRALVARRSPPGCVAVARAPVCVSRRRTVAVAVVLARTGDAVREANEPGQARIAGCHILRLVAFLTVVTHPLSSTARALALALHGFDARRTAVAVGLHCATLADALCVAHEAGSTRGAFRTDVTHLTLARARTHSTSSNLCLRERRHFVGVAAAVLHNLAHRALVQRVTERARRAHVTVRSGKARRTVLAAGASEPNVAHALANVARRRHVRGASGVAVDLNRALPARVVRGRNVQVRARGALRGELVLRRALTALRAGVVALALALALVVLRVRHTLVLAVVRAREAGRVLGKARGALLAVLRGVEVGRARRAVLTHVVRVAGALAVAVLRHVRHTVAAARVLAVARNADAARSDEAVGTVLAQLAEVARLALADAGSAVSVGHGLAVSTARRADLTQAESRDTRRERIHRRCARQTVREQDTASGALAAVVLRVVHRGTLPAVRVHGPSVPADARTLVVNRRDGLGTEATSALHCALCAHKLSQRVPRRNVARLASVALPAGRQLVRRQALLAVNTAPLLLARASAHAVLQGRRAVTTAEGLRVAATVRVHGSRVAAGSTGIVRVLGRVGADIAVRTSPRGDTLAHAGNAITGDDLSVRSTVTRQAGVAVLEELVRAAVAVVGLVVTCRALRARGRGPVVLAGASARGRVAARAGHGHGVVTTVREGAHSTVQRVRRNRLVRLSTSGARGLVELCRALLAVLTFVARRTGALAGQVVRVAGHGRGVVRAVRDLRALPAVVAFLHEAGGARLARVGGLLETSRARRAVGTSPRRLAVASARRRGARPRCGHGVLALTLHARSVGLCEVVIRALRARLALVTRVTRTTLACHRSSCRRRGEDCSAAVAVVGGALCASRRRACETGRALVAVGAGKLTLVALCARVAVAARTRAHSVHNRVRQRAVVAECGVALRTVVAIDDVSSCLVAHLALRLLALLGALRAVRGLPQVVADADALCPVSVRAHIRRVVAARVDRRALRAHAVHTHVVQRALLAQSTLIARLAGALTHVRIGGGAGKRAVTAASCLRGRRHKRVARGCVLHGAVSNLLASLARRERAAVLARRAGRRVALRVTGGTVISRERNLALAHTLAEVVLARHGVGVVVAVGRNRALLTRHNALRRGSRDEGSLKAVVAVCRRVVADAPAAVLVDPVVPAVAATITRRRSESTVATALRGSRTRPAVGEGALNTGGARIAGCGVLRRADVALLADPRVRADARTDPAVGDGRGSTRRVARDRLNIARLTGHRSIRGNNLVEAVLADHAVGSRLEVVLAHAAGRRKPLVPANAFALVVQDVGRLTVVVAGGDGRALTARRVIELTVRTLVAVLASELCRAHAAVVLGELVVTHALALAVDNADALPSARADQGELTLLAGNSRRSLAAGHLAGVNVVREALVAIRTRVASLAVRALAVRRLLERMLAHALTDVAVGRRSSCLVSTATGVEVATNAASVGQLRETLFALRAREIGIVPILAGANTLVRNDFDGQAMAVAARRRVALQAGGGLSVVHQGAVAHVAVVSCVRSRADATVRRSEHVDAGLADALIVDHLHDVTVVVAVVKARAQLALRSVPPLSTGVTLVVEQSAVTHVTTRQLPLVCAGADALRSISASSNSTMPKASQVTGQVSRAQKALRVTNTSNCTLVARRLLVDRAFAGAAVSVNPLVLAGAHTRSLQDVRVHGGRTAVAVCRGSALHTVVTNPDVSSRALVASRTSVARGTVTGARRRVAGSSRRRGAVGAVAAVSR
eukprot:Rhum_TRINITY_DN14505_c6_g1::Rhum_TRINITY_DN14505_c6_g1_i1::g.97964::m.97964